MSQILTQADSLTVVIDARPAQYWHYLEGMEWQCLGHRCCEALERFCMADDHDQALQR
jgi:hypothetical protein